MKWLLASAGGETEWRPDSSAESRMRKALKQEQEQEPYCWVLCIRDVMY